MSYMTDMQMQTPPPRLPRDEDASSKNLLPPPARPSTTVDDDLEPYNLPFTD